MILNETYVKNVGSKVGDTQAACYIHVDDDLFLTSALPREEAQCDHLMATAANWSWALLEP